MRALLPFALLLSLLTTCAPPPPSAHLSPDTPLPLNSLAPDFALADAHGGTVTLSQLTATRPVLLIFYLGYNCPRCVGHLHTLADRKPDFDKTGVQLLAISPNSVADTRESIDSYGDFPFPLLADPDMNVARSYGLVEGKDILFHAAIIIDTHRRIRFAVKSSHPYDDWDSLLDCLNSLNTARH